MIIKKCICALLIFLLCLVNTVFAADFSGNLYVKFQNKTYKQTIFIDVRDGNYQNTISCGTQITKSKLKNNGPSCEFKFKKRIVLIDQIKYSLLGKNPFKVCSELNGTKFMRGILYISLKSGNNNVHCTFKKIKTNIYSEK